MARDVKIDKYNLYDKSAINLWELADKDWSFSNDTIIANLNELEKKLDEQPHIPEKNPLQTSKGEKNYEPIEKKTLAENIENDCN